MVRQIVASQRGFEPRSVGSNPTGPTIHGSVVKGIRRSPSERDDDGSSPSGTTNHLGVTRICHVVRIRNIGTMVSDGVVSVMMMRGSNVSVSRSDSSSKRNYEGFVAQRGSCNGLLIRPTWDRSPPNPSSWSRGGTANATACRAVYNGFNSRRDLIIFNEFSLTSMSASCSGKHTGFLIRYRRGFDPHRTRDTTHSWTRGQVVRRQALNLFNVGSKLTESDINMDTWRSQVAQRTFNPTVAGSNPAMPVIIWDVRTKVVRSAVNRNTSGQYRHVPPIPSSKIF